MSLQEDERYMRLALEEAQLAYEAGEIPIGAVIVCDGCVIARAHNEVELLSDPTAHAEVLARHDVRWGAALGAPRGGHLWGE